MSVDVPDPAPEQRMAVDEMQDFCLGGNAGLGQVRHRVQHHFALAQIAYASSPITKGVREYPSRIKQPAQHQVAGAQMIYPHRRIDQDHAEVGRRRRGVLSRGSLPPRRANRRALSRSIRRCG
jgi:hypothetical protein